MSRSGYIDDYDDDNGAVAMYRGQVASAMRGRRGQAFLRDLLSALDEMPEKRLIAGHLVVPEVNPLLRWLFAPNSHSWETGSMPRHWRLYQNPLEDMPTQPGCCAIGALAVRRGVDVEGVDPEEAEEVAGLFDINEKLAREVVYMNDEVYYESPERRWRNMRAWVASSIKGDK
jgi:hypothetical protein